MENKKEYARTLNDLINIIKYCFSVYVDIFASENAFYIYYTTSPTCERTYIRERKKREREHN